MLISEETMVVLAGKNIKYFENLGYIIPREKDTKGRFSVRQGTRISVFITDLFPTSHALISYKCDGICGGKILENIQWCNYLTTRKDDGKSYCYDCSKVLFGFDNIRKAFLEKGKSIEEWCFENNRHDVLNRWDDKLNKYSASELNHKGESIKIYLKCPLGIHESEAKNLANLVNGYEGAIICRKCNSLACLYPNSLDFWSDLNDKTPNDYSFGVDTKVWWKCLENKHEDYERGIVNSIAFNFRCPSCVQEMRESFIQNKVREYIEILFDKKYIKHEYDTELICINPKTKRRMPYDNEIVTENFGLIIETHGIQHYKLSQYHKHSAKKNNTTPQEELDYIQWKDQYKMDYALDNGYYYLSIPYWEDDENETYKTSIDEMLEYIYRNN